MLIFREVLGFSAKETAEMLETTVASVNSALQRARAAVAQRVPAQSQQATLRALGDGGMPRSSAATSRHGNAATSTRSRRCSSQDASFAMPPLSTWYSPRDGIAEWARNVSLSGAWRWRTVLTRANGQPALAFYAWDERAGAYLPFALNVLSSAAR